jgi:uncharacterized membrane protein YebE (DUF533 family)
MIDLNRIVQGLAQSGVASGFVGGAAGGALTSALMSKKGRKGAKTLLKVGGLAAVGGLAWKAYQGYRQGQPENASAVAARDSSATPGAPAGAPELLPPPVAQDGDGPEAMLLVRAMIAAAMADGHMDGGEQERIFAEVNRLDLSAEEKAMLFDELRRPLPIDELARRASDPRIGAEVYAASLLAIDENRPEGRQYLDRLAGRLALPAMLVEALHARALMAKRDQAAA